MNARPHFLGPNETPYPVTPALPPTDEETREHRSRMRADLAWLVQLRTVATGGVILAGLLAWQRGNVASPVPLLAIAAAMALYNLALHLWIRREVTIDGAEPFRLAVMLQLTADIVALAALLHFSGGVDNPFSFFLVFHMAIGATLLDRTRAWAGAAVATAVYGTLVGAEYVGLLDHHDLGFHATDAAALHSSYRTAEYVFAHFVALTLALAGTVYFVRALAVRHRRVEARLEEHKRVVATRERMARIGEISAGVAHSIRNPLHGLLNCVDILKTKECDAHSPEILELMTEGMVRIQHITQRLLTLGADAPLSLHPTNLSDVVNDACAFVRVRGKGRDVRLLVEAQSTPDVPVDRNRLSEALMNIVDNAFAACAQSGTVRVRVSMAPPGSARPAVQVEIADDGCGIAPEAMPHIFHPFYTSKAIGEGTGLGLAISRRVVEEHDGSITVDSEVGRGTTVRIRLPLAQASQSEREARP